MQCRVVLDISTRRLLQKYLHKYLSHLLVEIEYAARPSGSEC